MGFNSGFKGLMFAGCISHFYLPWGVLLFGYIPGAFRACYTGQFSQCSELAPRWTILLIGVWVLAREYILSSPKRLDQGSPNFFTRGTLFGFEK